MDSRPRACWQPGRRQPRSARWRAILSDPASVPLARALRPFERPRRKRHSRLERGGERPGGARLEPPRGGKRAERTRGERRYVRAASDRGERQGEILLSAPAARRRQEVERGTEEDTGQERSGAKRATGGFTRRAAGSRGGWTWPPSYCLSLPEKMRLTEPKMELLRLLILASSAAVFLAGAGLAGEPAGVESELG
jgi:hypothetical protein